MTPGPTRSTVLGAALGAALLASLVLLAACGPGTAPGETRLLADLAAELPMAEIHREVRALDLGTEEARRHLLGGWSWNESTAGDLTQGAEDATFVWGIGEMSELELFLTEPRPLELRLRGRALHFEDAPPQTVQVEVNDTRIERLVLDPGREPASGRGTHTVFLPERALHSGINRLRLRYGWSRSPASLGLSPDDRRLAVAWSGLRLDPVPPPTGEVELTTGDDGTGRLKIPFGAGVDYFLEIPTPAGSETYLAIDLLQSLTSGGGSGAVGSLAVSIQEEGTAPVRAAKIGPVDRSGRHSVLRLPLRPAGREPAAAREAGPSPPRRLVRVGLRAIPEDPAAEGALLLVAPRLLTTAPPEPGDGAGAAARDTPAGGDGGRPNVLIYLVDTLRADRVGVYGGAGAQRGLTPRIDAFAAGATIYENAIAEAPWTRPTVASLLTGMPPVRHGVTTLNDRLTDAAVTLPEVFRDAGYRTAAFSTNWHVIEDTGMAQGFEDFVFLPDAVHADTLNPHVLDWLDRGLSDPDDDRPFFLYVHALDPHAPYEPPEPYRTRLAPEAPPGAGDRPALERIYAASPGSPERTERMQAIRDLYDAEVAAVDAAFGTLLDGLEARGLWHGDGGAGRDTVVAFVSDHGEGLDEHGHLGHGHDLYGEAIRVPLLVSPGDRAEREDAGRRVARAAQPSDLFHLLTRLLDGSDAPPARGEVPGDLSGATSAPRPVFSHLSYEGRDGVSVVLGEWKAIEPLSPAFGRRPQLYHLGRDPGERQNLGPRSGRSAMEGTAGKPVRLGYLRTLIRRHLRGTDEGALAAPAALDTETRKGLRALGYL